MAMCNEHRGLPQEGRHITFANEGGREGRGEGIVWCKLPISEKILKKTKKSILSPFKAIKISRWYSCSFSW